MKRIIALALLLAILPLASVLTERKGTGAKSAFAQEDIAREAALSAALGRTESGSSRFFLENSEKTQPRYIVKFSSAISQETLLSLLEGTDYRLLSHSGQRVFSLQLEDPAGFLARGGEAVLYCCEDSLRTPLGGDLPDDPLAGDLGTYRQAEIYGGWELISPKKELIVAVLDTGVDRGHEDLQGTNLLNGYDAVTRTAGVFEDDDGHGTAVTGVLAAAENGVGTAGVAYGVTVLPIRVAGEGRRIYSSDLIAGIRFAADAGARIINLSLGGYTYSAAEQDAVNYALEQGCILIAAAGNDGDTETGTMEMYPAAYQGVISVGSSDGEGFRSAFSQNDSYVDILAPGEDVLILAAGKTGADAYRRDDGTSYSAAMVSGIAVLALSALEPADVRFRGEEFLSLLASNHTRMPGRGYGLIDAREAVAEVNRPLITGVAHNVTYDTRVTVGFNRGVGYLDGEEIADGESVYADGRHVFAVVEGDRRSMVVFRVNRVPATYEKITTAHGVFFTYAGGTATLDGVPYPSGGEITSPGWHSFALTDAFGETVTEQFYLEADSASFTGVEDGGVYTHPVGIRTAGREGFLLDGVPVGKEFFVTEDGVHTLFVPGAGEITFTLDTGAEQREQGSARCMIALSREQGWYGLYGGTLSGMQIFDMETGDALGTLGSGSVSAHLFVEGKLLLLSDWEIAVFDSEEVKSGTALGETYTLPCDGLVTLNGVLYGLGEGELFTFSPEDGTRTALFETDCKELYTDGGFLWLYNPSENRFDRYGEDGLHSFYPEFPCAGKRKLFAVGRLFCGNACISLADLSVAFFTEGYALYAEDGRVFTSEGVYRLSDGGREGLLPAPLSSLAVGETEVYCYNLQGGLTVYPKTVGELLGYVPEAGSLTEKPAVSGSFGETVPFFGEASPAMLAARGNRLAAVFTEERKFLLWLDGVLTEETALPFAPTGVRIFEERICIWDGINGIFWLDGVQYCLGMPIDDMLFALGDVYILSGGSLYRIEDGKAQETMISADGAVGNGEVLAWQEEGVLYLAVDGEVQTVRNPSSRLLLDGEYLLCGQTLYSARDLSVASRISQRVLALSGGLLVTDGGILSAEDLTVLSSFSAENCQMAVLGGSCGVVFLTRGGLTVARYSFPLWEHPWVTGIPEDGLAEERVTLIYDRGQGFLDGVPCPSDTVVTAGGEHTFTLVLPAGLVREYTFYLAPALEGIAFVSDYRLAAGEEGRLGLQYFPAGTSAVPVNFFCEGDCIRVEADGSFAALYEGIATVYAVTEDGKFTASCTVTVEDGLLRFAPDAGLQVDRTAGILYGIPSGMEGDTLAALVLSPGEAVIAPGTVGTGTVLSLMTEGYLLDALTAAVEGDLDGDGYVTLGDHAVMREMLEKGTPFEGAFRYAGDLNGSGTVTDRDLNLLSQQLLKKWGNDRPMPDVKGGPRAGLLLPETVYAGDIFGVTVYLQDSAVQGMNGRLVYDGDALTFLRMESHGWQTEFRDNGRYVAFYAYGGERASASVVTLYFRVAEDCKEISLRLREQTFLAESGVTAAEDITVAIIPAERVYGPLNISSPWMERDFDPYVTEYDLYLPSDTLQVDLAITYPLGTEISVRNTVFGDEDRLDVEVIFRNETGDMTVYLFHAYRGAEPPVPVETTLAELSAAEAQIPFRPGQTFYRLTVAPGTDRLTLSWATADPRAQVVCSDTRLIPGKETEITLTVMGADGSQRVYTLLVLCPLADEEESGDPSEPSSKQPHDSSSAEEPAEDLRWLWAVLSVFALVIPVMGLVIKRKMNS